METNKKTGRGRSLRALIATLVLALLAALLLAGTASAAGRQGLPRPNALSPVGTISSKTPTLKWTVVKWAGKNAYKYGVRIFVVSTGAVLKKKTDVKGNSWTVTGLPTNVDLAWDVRGWFHRYQVGLPDAAGPWSSRPHFRIVPPSSEKAITLFDIKPVSTTVIDEAGSRIDVTVPSGTVVTALVAYFTVSPGASVAIRVTNPVTGTVESVVPQVNGVTSNDFRSPKRYWVTAADGSSRYYDVTVTVAASPDKAITAYSFQGLSPPVTGIINEAGNSIALTVPSGTDVTALIATFTASPGASVTITGTPQVSGVTSNNFSNQVRYTVTAADSTSRYYDVRVTVTPGPSPSPGSEKAITAFSFQGLDPPVIGTINEAARTITLTVPAETNVTTLVASFTTTGVSVSIAGLPQVSGVTANNFSNPVTYRVTAADASTQNYVVTVTVGAPPPSSAKAITAFSFASPAAPGVINVTLHTIALTVPYGTHVNSLIATFTTTGTGVSVAGVPQVSGVTANNFTNPVTYRVTAADTSTQDYVVTVTVAAFVPAHINAVNPARGVIGVQVTVSGSGFGPSGTVGSVLFGARHPSGLYFVGTAATIVSWSDTQIVCQVPAVSPGAMAICVKRTANFIISYSNDVAFTVDAPPV